MGDSLPAINVDQLTSAVNNAVNGGLFPHLSRLPPPPLPPQSSFFSVHNPSMAVKQSSHSQPRQFSQHSISSLVQAPSSVTTGTNRAAVDSRMAVPVYLPPLPGCGSRAVGGVSLPVPPLQVPFLGIQPVSGGGAVPLASLPSFQSQPLFSSSQTIQFPSQSFGLNARGTIRLSCSPVAPVPSGMASVTLLTMTKPASDTAPASCAGTSISQELLPIPANMVLESTVKSSKGADITHNLNSFSQNAFTYQRIEAKPSVMQRPSVTNVINSSPSAFLINDRLPQCYRSGKTLTLDTAGQSQPVADGGVCERDTDVDEGTESDTACETDDAIERLCQNARLADARGFSSRGCNGSHTTVGVATTTTTTTISSVTRRMSATLLTTAGGLAAGQSSSAMETPTFTTQDHSVVVSPKQSSSQQSEAAPATACASRCGRLTTSGQVDADGTVQSPLAVQSTAMPSASELAAASAVTQVSMPSCPAPPMFIMFSLRLPVLSDVVPVAATATSSYCQSKSLDGSKFTLGPTGPLLSPRLTPFPPFPLLFPFFPPPTPDDGQSQGQQPRREVQLSSGQGPRGPLSAAGTLLNTNPISITNPALPSASLTQTLPLPPLPLQLPTSLPFLPLPPLLPPQSLTSSGPNWDFSPLPPLILQPTGSSTSVPLPPFLQPPASCLVPFSFPQSASDGQGSQPFLPFPQQSFAPFIQNGMTTTTSPDSLPLPVPLLLPPLCEPVSRVEGTMQSSSCSLAKTIPSVSSVTSESGVFGCPPDSKGPACAPSFSLPGLPPLPLFPPPPTTSGLTLIPPLPHTPVSRAVAAVELPCTASTPPTVPAPQYSVTTVSAGTSQAQQPPVVISMAGQPLLPPLGCHLLPLPPQPPLAVGCTRPYSSSCAGPSPQDPGPALKAGKTMQADNSGEELDKSSNSDQDEMTIDETVTDDVMFGEMIIDEEADPATLVSATHPTACCFAEHRTKPVLAGDGLPKCQSVQEVASPCQLLPFSSCNTSTSQQDDNRTENVGGRSKVSSAVFDMPADVATSSLQVQMAAEQFDKDESQVFSSLYSSRLRIDDRKDSNRFCEETQRLQHLPLVSLPGSVATCGMMCRYSHSNASLASSCVAAGANYYTYSNSAIGPAELGGQTGVSGTSPLPVLPSISHSSEKEPHSKFHPSECLTQKEQQLPMLQTVFSSSGPSGDQASYYPVSLEPAQHLDTSYLPILPNPDTHYMFDQGLPACFMDAHPSVSTCGEERGLENRLLNKHGPDLFKQQLPIHGLSLPQSCASHVDFNHCNPLSFSEVPPVFTSLADHESAYDLEKDVPAAVPLSDTCHYQHDYVTSLCDTSAAGKEANKGQEENVAAASVALSESCPLQHGSYACLAAAEHGAVHGRSGEDAATARTQNDPCQFRGGLTSLAASDFAFPMPPAPSVSVDPHTSQTILPNMGYSPPGLSNHGMSPNLFSPGAGLPPLGDQPMALTEMTSQSAETENSPASAQGLELAGVSASVLDMLLMKADQSAVEKASVEMLGENSSAICHPSTAATVTESGATKLYHQVSSEQVSVASMVVKCIAEDKGNAPSSGDLLLRVQEDGADGLEPVFIGQFCLECNMVCGEPCKHGLLRSQHISDSLLLSRARATVPACLTLRPSGVIGHFNNTGVFCKTAVPAKTEFGPLQGKLTVADKESVASFSSWKIFLKTAVKILEIDDENVSNWMMFIKPARNAGERNLTAYQRGTDLMFITTRDIQPDTELLFWFAHDYCKMLSGKSKPPAFCPYCPVCGSVFFHRALQRSHTKQSHSSPEQPANRWSCSACDAQFRLHRKLTEHVMTCHMHLKPWVCTLCGKEFSQQRNFHTHMAMHEGERKFGCETCGKRFIQKAHLQYHQATHTKLTAAKCKFCNKSFMRVSDMRQHELKHTRARTLSCPSCSKTFHRAELLRRHVKRVHENQRDYLCERCSMSFHTKCKLTRHARFCSDRGKTTASASSSTPSSSSSSSFSQSSAAAPQMAASKLPRTLSQHTTLSFPSTLSTQTSALLAALNSVPVVIDGPT